MGIEKHQNHISVTAMSFLPIINLPWPITLHAFGLAFLGLYQTFRLTSSTKANSSSSKPVPANPMLGIATFGLSLAYLSTSYMPIEQNQFLYADEKRNLLVVAAYDGLGAVALGLWLGTFEGRVPGPY